MRLDPSVQETLEAAVAAARREPGGSTAAYIPELANANPELTSAAVTGIDGDVIEAGDAADHRFTLQSSAKVILLAGLLEDLGAERVFSVVGKEPTGGPFASIARLETHGPHPANPLVNTGAIALCGLLRGTLEDRIGWLEDWTARLCGGRTTIHQRVLASERRTGDRNRAIAYYLRHLGTLAGDVDETLETYFALCSVEGTVRSASHLAAVLATGGRRPGHDQRVLSPATSSAVVSLMATCGMYDESGAHLLETGMPAKSGVSGVIVAVAPGRAGIAVSSPRLNHRGGSVRGHLILQHLARELGWHFASAGDAPSRTSRED